MVDITRPKVWKHCGRWAVAAMSVAAALAVLDILYSASRRLTVTTIVLEVWLLTIGSTLLLIRLIAPHIATIPKLAPTWAAATNAAVLAAGRRDDDETPTTAPNPAPRHLSLVGGGDAAETAPMAKLWWPPESPESASEACARVLPRHKAAAVR